MNNTYQAPQSKDNSAANDSVVTIKEWIITILVMMIPLVNIVMMFVWAFGSGTKPSKANFFKAQLIFMAIVLVIYFIIFAVFGAALFSSPDLYPNN